MRQRNGVVGRGFGKGQMLLHLPGEADLAQEGDETGQTAERRNGFGVSSKTSLASPKSEAISVRVVLCRVGSGCLSINPYAHIPFRKRPFSISEFGLKTLCGSLRSRRLRVEGFPFGCGLTTCFKPENNLFAFAGGGHV